MKSFDKNLELAIIFLSLSITTQIMIILSFMSDTWLLFAISTGFGTWLFMVRAIKELKKEFQEIDDVI